MAKKFIYLKKEMRGILDIKETVKTLEKISAANIHRLKTVSKNMEDYEFFLEKIFCDTEGESVNYPLSKKISAPKRLCVVLTAEKGLCGGLLNNLVDFVQLNFKKNDELMVIGRKGKRLFEERGIKIKVFFAGWEEIPKEESIREIKDLLISQFLKEKYKEILVFYPSFENLGIQKPKLFTFLPFDIRSFKEKLKESFRSPSGYPIYEPSRGKIRDYLTKEYLGLVFYQKVLETKLSELSARTVAMEEAEEKAKQMLFRLSHQYFRARRATITEELNDLYSHRT